MHNARALAGGAHRHSEQHAFYVLCAHWFFATAALGVYFPYFALFLRENAGLSSSQVGLVISIPPLVGLLAQPVWGQLADRSGSRAGVLSVLCMGSALGYLALSQAHGLAPTVVATLLLSVFLSALFPLSTSVTFGALDSPSSFGRVRVWGTIGYFLVVLLLPPVLARWGASLTRLDAALAPAQARSVVSEPALGLAFYLAAGLTVIAGLLAWLVPVRASLGARAQRGDFRRLLSEPLFLRALLFTFGIQLCVHGPMQLFPLYVRARGGTLADLSQLWICMLILEVPLIFSSGPLLRRIGVARAMRWAAAAGGVRWVVCALVPTLAGVYAIQVLHAVTVAGLNVGTAMYVERIVPAHLRSTAQASVIMVGSGIAGVLSATIGGFVVEHLGVDALFLAGGLLALLWVGLGRDLLSNAPSAQPNAAM